MTNRLTRLRVTLDQMERLFETLDGMRELHLPDDPLMYSILSEGPLDLLRRMRDEAADLAAECEQDESAAADADTTDAKVQTSA